MIPLLRESSFWLMIAIAGMTGTAARFTINRFYQKHFQTTFPYATLTINLLGSFIAGFSYALMNADDRSLQVILMALGAFTTFSTMNVEFIQMMKNKSWQRLFLYMSISYLGGPLIAALGYYISP
jgi:CrcB protein